MVATNGGSIVANDMDISSMGTTAVGLIANRSGTVVFNGGRISTSGLNSDGAVARNGGHLDIGRDANGVGTLIQLGGDNARGVSISSATARIDGATIEINGGRGTGVVGAAGVVTSQGGDALVTDTAIITSGLGADGLNVEGDSSMTVRDSSVLTTGDSAKGAVAYDGNGSLLLDNVSIRTEGAGARGVVSSGVSAGVSSSVTMHGGSITTTGAGSIGAQSAAGAVMQLSQLSIDATATGVQAIGAGRVDMSDVDILTHEGYAHAVEATGSGAVVTGSNIRATTLGQHAYGLRANEGGWVDVGNVIVDTNGVYAHGAVADTAGSNLTLASADITTQGEVAMGARAYGGGVVALTDVRLTTHGNGAYGLDAMGAGSQLRADNVLVETFGANSGGTTASAVVAEWGGQLDIHNSQVKTHGASAMGLLSQVAGDLGDTDTVLNAVGVQVLTVGDNAFGAMACSLIVGAGDACASPNYSGAAMEGANAFLNIDDSRIETNGIGSHGLYAYGPAGASIVANGSAVLTTGEGAHGVVAEFGADVQLNDSHVRAEGAGAVGALVIDSTLSMAGGTLSSSQDSAIRSDAGDISLSAGAQIIGGNGVFVEQIGNAGNRVQMSDRAIAMGDVVFGNGASTAATSLSLDDASVWIGKTNGVVDVLQVAGGSTWQMTGDSTVGQLSLNDGVIAFQAPSTNDFKTLTVTGDFVGNGGTLLMNTVLGDDHSATDKLHVLGDTSGQAYVAVNNVGGAGAQTLDGIQIVEVNGASNAEFNLSGRAVGGQYEYFLFKGGKADPNDGDWYLRSELPPIVQPDPCELDPSAPGCIDPIDPTDPPAPVLRPEIGAYLANQSVAVGMFQHAMHDRLGEPNLAERLKDDDKLGSVWARVTRNQVDYGVGEGQIDVSSDSSLLQIGSDIARWGQTSRGQVGFMAAAGQANSTATSALTGYAAKGKVDGVALGVYGNWFARPDEAVGTYVDAWLQAGRYKNSVHGDGLVEERYDAQTLTGSVEIGYAWKVFANEARAFYLEPQAQFIYTDYRSDDHMEANGTVVSAEQGGGLTTRVGLRAYGHAINMDGNRVQPFVTANWYHQSNINSVAFDGEALEGGTPKDRYELKVGAQLQLGSGWTGWGHLSGQSGKDSYRDIGGQVGLKYSW
ncbi:hypothetical protein ARC23_16500 [Stenotrophomonas beteli]|uniref:Autotransporter domain-containing protein n=2 Tax=Stenotrophomonas beteli TaxID=3384461 RepID=A0A0R0B3Y4_9GAMM|nr:hypothetical protein ARC23_16500 [Stenotrophomonas maltophilia]